MTCYSHGMKTFIIVLGVLALTACGAPVESNDHNQPPGGGGGWGYSNNDNDVPSECEMNQTVFFNPDGTINLIVSACTGTDPNTGDPWNRMKWGVDPFDDGQRGQLGNVQRENVSGGVQSNKPAVR